VAAKAPPGFRGRLRPVHHEARMDGPGTLPRGIAVSDSVEGSTRFEWTSAYGPHSSAFARHLLIIVS
jgi:hypothetical protein